MNKVAERREVLRLICGKSNPAEAECGQLFLLQGDATRGPVKLDPSAAGQIPVLWQYNDRPFRLKILHFNDLHGHFLHIDRKSDIPVFSKIAAYIRQTRLAYQDDPYAGVLVFSGGDEIVSSPFEMLTGSDLQTYQTHAGYQLYSKAGIDAAIFGNHEFDLGLDLLAHAIRTDASFPLLCANLRPTPLLEGLYSPAAIFTVRGVRIGVIGLTTPAQKRGRRSPKYEVVDPIPVMKRLLPVVRSLSDVVIVLSHLGQSLKSATAPVHIAGDVELAQSLPFGSVNLIIGAHTHDPLNETGLDLNNLVNGIPIAQAGSNGRYLGEVDIVLRKAPILAHLSLHHTQELPEDAAFEERYVRPLYDRIRPYLERRLGSVEENGALMTSVCCMDASYKESVWHNFICDGLVTRCRAQRLEVDFAMLEASAIQSGLELGQEFTIGDWLRIMPYADTLVLCTLTGSELYELIQDNARRIDISGEPHIERGFLHFSKEIRYRIQVNPLRSQIQAVDIQVGGEPIEKEMDRTYQVACTSFFRGLARHWENQKHNGLPLLIFHPENAQGIDTGWFVRDLIMDHIRQYNGITQQGGAVQDGRMVTF
ncbi:MAG: bifunctional UDP-sugar hydrolase/5'-nucleotidase [Anaerolineaceae bacterium]|nr:bifunctional UDP-sugar hydrolase/5'-nucleotidase [Anaerolineaceae bacterium]